MFQLSCQKMKRLKIHRSAYRASNLIFQILCITGLLFQIITISVYYFRHEIVSDIKLIQPEDVESEKSVNICFMAHEVLNHDIYSDILNDRYHNMSESVENIRRKC